MESQVTITIGMSDDIKQVVKKNYKGFITEDITYLEEDISDKSRLNHLIHIMQMYKETLEHNIKVLESIQIKD